MLSGKFFDIINMIMPLKSIFTKYFPEEEFIRFSSEKLRDYGFNHENTITGVCLCRDEICQSALFHIRNQWGEVFNFASLAGFYSIGKIGLEVFISHAPKQEENIKCLFYVFTHIGIDEDGNVGVCSRKGIKESTACGALISLHKEISVGLINPEERNFEIDAIRNRLGKELSQKIPSLLELTKLTLRATSEDIEKIMENHFQSDNLIYGLISGIQVHYKGINYIVPEDAFISLNNKRVNIALI